MPAAQIASYIKRNKKAVRGVGAMDTVTDIVAYAKANNFVKHLVDTPDFGDHQVGVILVFKGRILDACNEWMDLPHAEEHQQQEAKEGNVIPASFTNLLDVVFQATAEPSRDTLARVTAAINECLNEAEGCVTESTLTVII